MLSNLNPNMRLLAQQPPATLSEIDQLSARFTHVPAEYIDLITSATEIEFKLIGDKKRYFRIWGPEGCLEFDIAHMISTTMPDSLPIGDDGSGRCILYMYGKSGWGLYLSDLAVLDPGRATFTAPSLKELLITGTGIDVF